MKKLLALSLLIAAPLLAGLSKKYKGWEKSPEAYFLTREENAQWKKIKSDEDAEKFVAQYHARRPAAFWEDFSQRVVAADKFFSAGSTKGSETLRGKVVILFGPPTSVFNGEAGAGSDPSKSGGQAQIAASQTSATGGGSSGNVSMGSGGGLNPLNAPHSSGVTRESYPTVTFVYDEKVAPKAISKAFRISVRVISGKEQEPVDEKDLDEKTEAVAKASLEPVPAH
jgi:GWxTD domain-containing protein